MSNFILNLEPLAGSGILHCAMEAQTLADNLGVLVKFQFNTVSCYAKKGGDCQWLAQNFRDALQRPETVIGRSAWSHIAPKESLESEK